MKIFIIDYIAYPYLLHSCLHVRCSYKVRNEQKDHRLAARVYTYERNSHKIDLCNQRDKCRFLSNWRVVLQRLVWPFLTLLRPKIRLLVRSMYHEF